MIVKVTKYYVLSQEDYGNNNIIPIKDNNANIITYVDPICFGDAACEGTMRLLDGRVLNVTGHWVPCDANTAMTLKQIADTRYKGRYNYVGLSNDFKLYTAFTITASQWGTASYHSEPLYPFYTCAVDPTVFALGSTLYVAALANQVMPDGSTHNGYLWAIDTGGGIKGQHIDWFCGSRTWAKAVQMTDTTDAVLYSTNQ